MYKYIKCQKYIYFFNIFSVKAIINCTKCYKIVEIFWVNSQLRLEEINT